MAAVLRVQGYTVKPAAFSFWVHGLTTSRGSKPLRIFSQPASVKSQSPVLLSSSSMKQNSGERPVTTTRPSSTVAPLLGPEVVGDDGGTTPGSCEASDGHPTRPTSHTTLNRFIHSGYARRHHRCRLPFRIRITMLAAMPQPKRSKPGLAPPSKIGRPARAGQAATHVVCARITDDEHAAWALAAAGLPLGEWVRKTCNAASRRRTSRKAGMNHGRLS